MAFEPVRRLMAAIRGTEHVEGDVQKWLRDAADMGADRCSRYRLYQEFYDGNRGAKLRDRAKKYLEQNRVPFTENFCDVVVDSLAERLNVIGFTSSEATTALVDGKEVTEDPFGSLAEEWWQRNRMDAVQKTVHVQALMKGDEYVIVEWSEELGRPRFLRQRQHQVKVCYSEDEPDTIEYAVKVWSTSRRGPSNPSGARVRRMNLYFPDRVEKWFSLSKGDGDKDDWARWTDEGDTGWPVWWTTSGAEDGDPLGIPVVHFRHRPLGDGHGRSRVKPAVPFQEQLNKYAADLNDLVDNHALPQDWVAGVAAENPTFKRVAGNIWQAADKEAKFGRLDATDTSNLLNVIEGVLSRLGRRSRIPMHLLTGGTPPSGESLKTAESGLVATAKDCQVEFGNSWEDAVLVGFRLAAAFGEVEGLPDVLPDGLTLSAQWANPETRSDEADLNVATLKKNLGVSRHTLLGELGYDAEKEAELRAVETEEAQAAFAGILDGTGER